MEKVNVNEILESLQSESANVLKNKEGKIEQKNLSIMLFRFSDEIQTQIREALIEKDLLQLSKGESSYSMTQRKIKDYFEKTFFDELIASGKTKFSLDTKEIQNYFREEKEGHCILNANGHLVLPKVNMTDVTERRRVQKAKENQEKLDS